MSTATNPIDALELARQERPTVILMDGEHAFGASNADAIPWLRAGPTTAGVLRVLLLPASRVAEVDVQTAWRSCWTITPAGWWAGSWEKSWKPGCAWRPWNEPWRSDVRSRAGCITRIRVCGYPLAGDASAAYVSVLERAGARISMARRGNPYDNAVAESFMKTLKREEVHLTEYRTLEHVRQRLTVFLEAVYNRKRLHSALGYRPPVEFELLDP